MPRPDPFVGREILGGEFKVLERIGTGGMGSVYRALQPSMSRLVAIKILHPHLALRPDLITRFRREARAMSQLTHPNTVKVFMYGELPLDPGFLEAEATAAEASAAPESGSEAQTEAAEQTDFGSTLADPPADVELSGTTAVRAPDFDSADGSSANEPARPRAGSLYIVMEHLEGETLSRRLKREGHFELTTATRLIRQVCGAVAEAHEKGIVHRDLKPENIFICRHTDLDVFPKVLDFGLAKIAETELRPGSIQLTQEGMVFGTPEFMSPEQAQGRTLDARSDLYSLAVILYELLTGHLPFQALTPADYLQKHVLEPPIALNQRVPGMTFPLPLQAAIERALAKDPSARFASVAEFAEAISYTAAVPVAPAPRLEPVSSRREPMAAGFGPGALRVMPSYPVLLLVAGVFLLVGAAVAVVFTWLFHR
jgi:serine/threonine protein kinase